MPRVNTLAVRPPGNYAVTGQAFTWTVLSLADGQSVPMSGLDLLVVRNPTAGAITITVHSTGDQVGRTGNVQAVSIPAGGSAVFGPFPMLGWIQADGRIYLNPGAAGLEFVVFALA